MPELPEVEVTKRAIAPDLTNKKVVEVNIRFKQLRWPVPEEINAILPGKLLNSILRRGKYLIFNFEEGSLILHLGMSGCLKLLKAYEPYVKHDHFEMIFEDDLYLRLNDPRRFGSVLWTDQDYTKHPLILNLGVEPFSDSFTPDFLAKAFKKKSSPVKSVIMNSKIVVGVGNIYANEALYAAGIHPLTPAKEIDNKKLILLYEHIRRLLAEAIKQGGTTLKDFSSPDGKPGYFSQSLNVYGLAGSNCGRCGDMILETKINGRHTAYCNTCQR